MRPAYIGQIAILLMIVASLTATTSRAETDVLPEAQSIDAQIARSLLYRPDSSGHAERIQTLIPDAYRNCLPITENSPETDYRPRTPTQSDLEVALRQLEQSETGAWLVQIAAARNVILCLDHVTALEAHYRSHLRLLGLSSRLTHAGRIVFLAHELAHVPQHPNFSNNRRFSPEEMLLLQRVREAAAEAVATRVLWQLRQQGIQAPWQEKLNTAYRDIAETFEKAMAESHGNTPQLWATRSAFHQWFHASWRLEIYDDLMLKTLARIAADPTGLVPTSKYLSDRYLLGIANYAGQKFLADGDGQALIKNFRNKDLPAGGRARLDAILAKSGNSPSQVVSFPLPGAALSAVNSKSKIGHND